MDVRCASVKDAYELSHIDKIANSEIKGWSPNSKNEFVSIIKKRKQILILARENGIVIGYLSMRKDKDSRWLWIEDVYVLGKWRKKGIAKALIKEMLDYHRKKLARRKIVLLTSDRNLEIFNKMGFKKTMNFMQYIG